jgi:uncharacterized protein
MPEYLAPGVYVEEISTGPKPIEGVSTSVAGFLGPTERGPEDIRYITSWLAYQRWYGGHLGVDGDRGSFLSYAVQGFFDNGGQRCFVGRIVAGVGATRATVTLDGKLTLSAVGRGAWGNRVFVRVRPSSQTNNKVERAAKWVRLTVYYYSKPPGDAGPLDPENRDNALVPGFVRPDVTEDYDNLSLDPKAANFLVTAVNQGSYLIRTEYTGLPDDTLAPAGITPLVNGADTPDLTLVDYQGDVIPIELNKEHLYGQGWGFAAMDTVDEVSLLLAPDQAKDSNTLLGDNLTQEIVTRCERLKDRFAVLSTPRVFSDGGKPSFDTTFGAQYFPWIVVYDPYARGDSLVPPSGHVAGIMARTDLEQGVHKAPANAVVIGAKGLQKPVPKGIQDRLNPVGINCIRDFRSDGRGIRLWGARTMSSDPEWKYVNVRRLFLFIEESIDEGTQWVVFEANAPSTWARVQQTVANFLTTVWRNGALVGGTRDEAFFVKCDRTTMTQDDIDNGRLICYVGVAPVKPAEFVIFRIGQKTSDAPA